MLSSLGCSLDSPRHWGSFVFPPASCFLGWIIVDFNSRIHMRFNHGRVNCVEKDTLYDHLTLNKVELHKSDPTPFQLIIF